MKAILNESKYLFLANIVKCSWFKITTGADPVSWNLSLQHIWSEDQSETFQELPMHTVKLAFGVEYKQAVSAGYNFLNTMEARTLLFQTFFYP